MNGSGVAVSITSASGSSTRTTSMARFRRLVGAFHLSSIEELISPLGTTELLMIDRGHAQVSAA
ncbi:MAG: hypothetical protein WEC34_09200 [Acidimicrobiia bacterium]